MKTSNKALLIGAAIVLIAGTAMAIYAKNTFQKFTIKGSGNLIEEVREVGEFTGVNVGHGITLKLSQGENTEVKVKSDDNIINHVTTVVTEGVLKIRYKNKIVNNAHTTVFVTSNLLNSIKASSGSEVSSEMELKIPQLNLKASSGAIWNLKIQSDSIYCEMSSGSEGEIVGTSSFMNLKLSSGGEIDAQSLVLENCKVKTSSGGIGKLNVNSSLEVNASSGGEIYYKGNAKVNSKLSSGGSVIKTD